MRSGSFGIGRFGVAGSVIHLRVATLAALPLVDAALSGFIALTTTWRSRWLLQLRVA